MYECCKNEICLQNILPIQVEFLISKKELDSALILAKKAINLSPNEFIVWEKLFDVYLELEDYESVNLISN
jgi:hypothetical protein